ARTSSALQTHQKRPAKVKISSKSFETICSMWVAIGHASCEGWVRQPEHRTFEEDAMIRARRSAVGWILVGLAALASAGCGQRMHSDASDIDDELTACSFSTTHNSYDGPNFWGTITVKNNGPGSTTGFSVAFDVPSGAHCTNDAVPSGATLSPLNGSG